MSLSLFLFPFRRTASTHGTHNLILDFHTGNAQFRLCTSSNAYPKWTDWIQSARPYPSRRNVSVSCGHFINKSPHRSTRTYVTKAATSDKFITIKSLLGNMHNSQFYIWTCLWGPSAPVPLPLHPQQNDTHAPHLSLMGLHHKLATRAGTRSAKTRNGEKTNRNSDAVFARQSPQTVTHGSVAVSLPLPG